MNLLIWVFYYYLTKLTAVSRARVIYSYAPTQPDELPLQIDEVINILDKELEDEGWWKGELNGRVGVFPDNFVEEIVGNEKVPGSNGKAFGVALTTWVSLFVRFKNNLFKMI